MGLLMSYNCPSYHVDLVSFSSFGVGYLFWQFPVYFVEDCWAVGCNFCFFFHERGHLLFFCSAILIPFLLLRVLAYRMVWRKLRKGKRREILKAVRRTASLLSVFCTVMTYCCGVFAVGVELQSLNPEWRKQGKDLHDRGPYERYFYVSSFIKLLICRGKKAI